MLQSQNVRECNECASSVRARRVLMQRDPNACPQIGRDACGCRFRVFLCVCLCFGLTESLSPYSVYACTRVCVFLVSSRRVCVMCYVRACVASVV